MIENFSSKSLLVRDYQSFILFEESPHTQELCKVIQRDCKKINYYTKARIFLLINKLISFTYSLLSRLQCILVDHKKNYIIALH